MKRNTDLFGGLFMLAVSLIFLTRMGRLNEYSKIFPRAIIFILIVAGGALIIKSFIKPTLSKLFVIEDKKSALLVAVVSLIWVLTFRYIGFVITGVVCLTLLLFLLSEKYNIKALVKSFVIAGILLGSLYLLFSRVLYVPFPRGMFF